MRRFNSDPRLVIMFGMQDPWLSLWIGIGACLLVMQLPLMVALRAVLPPVPAFLAGAVSFVAFWGAWLGWLYVVGQTRGLGREPAVLSWIFFGISVVATVGVDVLAFRYLKKDRYRTHDLGPWRGLVAWCCAVAMPVQVVGAIGGAFWILLSLYLTC